MIIGILQKATEAKTRTERQSIVEQARTDVLGYEAENKGGDLEKSQLKNVLETYFKDVPDLTDMEKTAILNIELETLDKYGTHTIKVSEIYNGNIRSSNDDNSNYAPYDNPYIPTNFTHTTGTWNTGFTIKGDSGTTNENDEFVWVPCVLDQTKVKPTDTVQTFGKITTGNYNANSFPLHPSGGTNESVSTEDESVSSIRTSVETYGGFYIAKYEAGINDTIDAYTKQINRETGASTGNIIPTDGSVKPLSQANKGVWNYITRNNAIIVSNAMIPSSTGVKSALISGECWDTTLAWITSTADAQYAENSEGKGNYSNNYPDNGVITGYYGINTNNIFDMAGNAGEWTTENCVGQYRNYSCL